MWCDRIIRNLARSTETKPVDWVEVDWNELGRVLKRQSRAGVDLRVILPPGQRLSHGDVIFEDDRTTIAINVRPSAVIVVQLGNPRQTTILALELGNLHWPTQVSDSELIFAEDGPVMAVLEKLGVSWTRQSRRFQPEPINFGVSLSKSFEVIRGKSTGVSESSRGDK